MSASNMSALRPVLAWGTLRSSSFPDRVAAAKAAGFPAIGMMIRDYLALRRSGWSDPELNRVLQDYDVTIDEIEVLFGFAADPGPAGIPERPGLIYADAELERAAFHMADVFGVQCVQAVGAFGSAPPSPRVVDAFAELCDRAAHHGLSVALEFVPYTDIPDLATASQIVADAGRDNGGLCMDSWHFFRGRPDFALLERVQPTEIFMIQINDGTLVPENPNRMEDAVHNRRCPGEGEFDLARWLKAMDRPGLAASASVEIYSDRLDRLPSTEAAIWAAKATKAVLDAERLLA